MFQHMKPVTFSNFWSSNIDSQLVSDSQTDELKIKRAFNLQWRKRNVVI